MRVDGAVLCLWQHLSSTARQVRIMKTFSNRFLSVVIPSRQGPLRLINASKSSTGRNWTHLFWRKLKKLLLLRICMSILHLTESSPSKLRASIQLLCRSLKSFHLKIARFLTVRIALPKMQLNEWWIMSWLYTHRMPSSENKTILTWPKSQMC